MAFFPEEFTEFRQLFPGRTLQAVLFRLKVNPDPDAGVIQHCRNNRRFYNINIGNTYEFRHQEGRRPHNGRHQLAAGGGRRFYRAGESRTVS